MLPSDVPAELVEKVKPALRDLLATEGVFPPADHPRFDHVARRVLAAVLPEYGARLLDQVKQAIQHEASKTELNGDWLRAWTLATGHAASVVSEHAARLTEGDKP